MDYYQKKCIILILNESWCVLLPGTRPVRPPSGGSKFIYFFFFMVTVLASCLNHEAF